MYTSKAWPKTTGSLMAILTAGTGLALLLLVSRNLPDVELATFNVLWALIFTASGIFNGASLAIVSQVQGLPDSKESRTRNLSGKRVANSFFFLALVAAGIALATAGLVSKLSEESLRITPLLLAFVSLSCFIAIVQLYIYTTCLADEQARSMVPGLYFIEAVFRLAGVSLGVFLQTDLEGIFGAIVLSAIVTLLFSLTWMIARGVSLWPTIASESFGSFRNLLFASLGTIASVLLMVGIPTVLSLNTLFLRQTGAHELLSVLGILRAPILLPINFFLGLFVAFAAVNQNVARGIAKKTVFAVTLTSFVLSLAVITFDGLLMEMIFPTLAADSIPGSILGLTVLGAGALGVFTIEAASLIACGKSTQFIVAWWVCAILQAASLLAFHDLLSVTASLVIVPLLTLGAIRFQSRFSRNALARLHK